MTSDSSLKEYYLRLQNMYENAVNMLTAINQSLSTTSSEITVNVVDTDNTTQTVKIPSYLYLESKLEEIGTTIDNIFKMPEDGEAWFTNTGNMYKLNLIKSNTAPITPTFGTDNINASISSNNIFKDMVLPKTYLKININNLPENIEQMYMRKITFANEDIFNAVKALNVTDYNDYKAALYNLISGVDYEEYDSVLDLPIKKDYYNSNFKILSIPTSTETSTDNPSKDPETGKLLYRVVLDTLKYTNEEDSAIEYNIKVGDTLCLVNVMTKYIVKEVNTDTNEIVMEEFVGHSTLQTFDENDTMILKIYAENYSQFHYVNVPLEENQYMLVFLGTIYNNVRSILSDGYLVDLSTIKMVDANGNYIKDVNGNIYTYMQYYNEYCINTGDILLGLSQSTYPQITNFTKSDLEELFGSDVIKKYVTETFSGENIIKVIPINKHLTDDKTSEDIKNLHEQKNEINSKLTTCQENINNVYSTLLSTDFSKNVSVKQSDLQNQLTNYYTERNELQTQFTDVVNSISSKSESLDFTSAGTKYRIRGISDISKFESYITTKYGRCNIIGIDIEYKYKTTLKETNDIITINGNTFTDWNKQNNIDKERKLVFTDTGYYIDFDSYIPTDNVIKWNQFDIPITSGEDVVIRVRYKYNIGQPFLNLYTPWSDEITINFPTEYKENQEIANIVTVNNTDVITSKLNTVLINDGYTEHIQNKILSNQQTFFHLPENIYSGFNTSENNLISLKDKLTQMSNDLDSYNEYVNSLRNNSYEVYLSSDDGETKLSPNIVNKINVYNTDNINDRFIKKNMSIIIKNTGNSVLKLYSPLPGKTDTQLIMDNTLYYMNRLENYQRVPIIQNNELQFQTLGQWIYFRENNPMTFEDIYFNEIRQNATDYQNIALKKEKSSFIHYPEYYMNKDNKQILFAFKNKHDNTTFDYNKIGADTDIKDLVEKIHDQHYIDATIDMFRYNVLNTNDYISRYEDIMVFDGETNIYLDENTALSSFVKKRPNHFTSISDFNGAFLYPNIMNSGDITAGSETNSFKGITAGSNVAVPITFEYYLTGSTNKEIKKSLYFEIKPSLMEDPVSFMIEITGNYDYSSSANIYNNIDQVILT